MSYEKQTWVNGDVITANKLNHIENGIDAIVEMELDDTLSVAGKAADAKTVGDMLENYALIDGAYEGMTVGNAEQLVSTVFEEDQTPYLFRTSGGSIDIGDREIDEIVGGSIAWNQLNAPTNNRSRSINGLTFTNNEDGSVTVTGQCTSTTGYSLITTGITVPSGHVCFICGYNKTSNGVEVTNGTSETSQPVGSFGRFVQSSGTAIFINLYVPNGVDFGETGVKVYPQFIDLTQMFGSAVADYLYNLEIGTSGAGVAFFKKLFPKPYYAYNAGTLMHVSGLVSHDLVGFNAYDAESGKAKVVCNQQYQITGTYTSLSLDGETVTPDASGYFTPDASGELTVTGGGADTCVHLVWDGERDGEYEEYVKHSYALDSSLTLRGVPKLDGSNNLYFDGDTYESDGTVTRRYGIVDMGSITWTYKSSTFGGSFEGYISNAGYQLTGNVICPRYVAVFTGSDVTNGDKVIYAKNNGVRLYIKDTAYTDASALATALSGVYLVYELETPTTETADPYTNPQIVDDFGTEEYICTTEADVTVPVGHVTQYAANLRAKLEMLPDSPDGNGDYIMRQVSGENSFVPLTKELPTAPSEDGTYVLKCTVTSGTPVLSWERES